MIVSAPNQGDICEGFLGLFPGGVTKTTLVIARVIELPHLW